MIVKLFPENPNERQIETICQCLSKGGVIIFPTDTLYAIGCDLTQIKAAEQVAKLKEIKIEKAHFSIVCSDLSVLSQYALPISNALFRLMKRCLPGPYTFIMEANSNVPKLFHHKKKTIGLRVPDHSICKAIVDRLGNPLLVASVPEDKDIENYTNPELIHERYQYEVDMVVDGGISGAEPSTVIDCTSGEPVVLRWGKGKANDIS